MHFVDFLTLKIATALLRRGASSCAFACFITMQSLGLFVLLKSLDNLHTRLQLTFDDLDAPSFSVTEISDNEINVHYSSERELPLEFFVIGLIHGIFDMFNQSCQVEIIPALNGEKGVFKVIF